MEDTQRIPVRSQQTLVPQGRQRLETG